MGQTQVAPLLAHIARSIIAPRLKRRLFRPSYLPVLTYLVAYQEAFEVGVVLGYAYRSKMLDFARLLCSSGSESEFVGFIQQLASERLAAQPYAKTLVDLGMAYEDRRIRRNWQESGVKETEIAVLGKSFKMPAESVWSNIGIALSTGIGFGSCFPGQTEQLWKNEHEYPISEERWRTAKAAGLVRANESREEVVTLADGSRDLIASVETFAAEYRPDVLPDIKGVRQPIEGRP